MPTLFATYNARYWAPLLLTGVLISPFPAVALEPEPHPMDTFLTDILNFQNPTRIRGTLRYVDKNEQALWLNWEQRSDDRPLFETGWKLVPGEARLLVYPQDSVQFDALQHVSKGTPLEMVIQRDAEGHRRILSFQNLSLPREIPL